MALDVQSVTLAIIFGMLAAIIYSLRMLILMERRVMRIEKHIESIIEQVGKTVSKRKK